MPPFFGKVCDLVYVCLEFRYSLMGFLVDYIVMCFLVCVPEVCVYVFRICGVCSNKLLLLSLRIILYAMFEFFYGLVSFLDECGFFFFLLFL